MGSSVAATTIAGNRPITAHQQDKAVNQGKNVLFTATREQIESIRKVAISRLISSASRPDHDLRVLTGHLCTIDYLEHVLADWRQRDSFSSQVKLPRKSLCSTRSYGVLPSTLVTVEHLEVVGDSKDISNEATSTCPELTDVSNGSDSDDEEHSCDDDDDDWERLALTRTVSYHNTIPIMSKPTGETVPVNIA